MHLLHGIVVLNMLLGSLFSSYNNLESINNFSSNSQETTVIELFNISDFSPGDLRKNKITFENKETVEVQVYLTSVRVQEYNDVIRSSIVNFDAYPDFNVNSRIGENFELYLFNVKPKQTNTFDLSVSLLSEANNSIQNQVGTYYFEFTIVLLSNNFLTEQLPLTGSYSYEYILLSATLFLGACSVLFMLKKEKKS